MKMVKSDKGNNDKNAKSQGVFSLPSLPVDSSYCDTTGTIHRSAQPPIANCETQPPVSIGWVALSSVFVRLFVCFASVRPPLISTIWCFRPYKPYIFCEYMILATCQCHSLLSWAQFSFKHICWKIFVWKFKKFCIIWKRFERFLMKNKGVSMFYF